MADAMDDFGLPAGRYDAELRGVDLIEPKGRKPWLLELTVKVQRNGRELVVRRELSTTKDPYDLTTNRRRSLRDFASKLEVQSTGPVEEIIAAMRALVGETVKARVRPGRFGLSITLSRGDDDPDAPPEPVSGDVLDALPVTEPDYRQRTVDAQGAHEQLLTGLRHAHRGLALAAEACWKLRNDEGWVALGYDSVGAYLADPDVSISRSQFYALADIHDSYVVHGGLEQQQLTAGPSKLEVPIPAIKAGEVTAEEALADAEVLGLRDLREKYRNGDGASNGKAQSVKLPFACLACGTLIESTDQARPPDGVEYHGHRWPAGWSHEQVVAAFQAGQKAAA